jgi:hypothetical protein
MHHIARRQQTHTHTHTHKQTAPHTHPTQHHPAPSLAPPCAQLSVPSTAARADHSVRYSSAAARVAAYAAAGPGAR